MILNLKKTMSANILFFDTSFENCIVAIIKNGSAVSYFQDNRKIRHSFKLMPLIDESLKKEKMELADFDYFAVSTGPGTFTGIRISISVAKTFAYVFNKKILGLNNLVLNAELGLTDFSFTPNFFNKRTGDLPIPVYSIINSGGCLFYCSEFSINSNKILKPVKENFIIRTDALKNLASESENRLFFFHKNCQKEFDNISDSEDRFNFGELNNDNCGVILENVNKKIAREEFFNAFELLPEYIKISDAEYNYETKN
ncbi:MAG TPA: tRNA (adenosine(37)-N6)-threonylcarbamoyltransferase complex dimerization subunit type 1 TsaB [bacterium]|nr:tRNA (adenosine(37)-N6)-threonylcarbamoyltransferase complex dimerization subunit type 1 TsaB [bacterium]